MSAIQVEQIQKTFKGTAALKSVSLTVNDGEFCVLLGASGCGKTTLLRIIAGLETSDSGSVHIGNKEVTHKPPRERNIAMVFQNYAVFPHMTIRDNIGFGLKMKGSASAEIDRQVKRCAELMHIEHLLDRYAGQLSGGQRQRVAVARALAVKPDVLLMDEPLSNLDALLRLEMRSELKGLLRELGSTTIYVTHDQVEAMSLADRIAVMNGGVIEQYDSPMKVYTHPATQFVGGFMGNPPMNFLTEAKDWSALGLTGRQFVLPTKARTLGIRPEHLSLSPELGLECQIKVLELLGSVQQATLVQIGGNRGQALRISVPVDIPLTLGQTIHLRASQEHARWYTDLGVAC
jgi:multiple sugar transport system ATP-binding protein